MSSFIGKREEENVSQKIEHMLLSFGFTNLVGVTVIGRLFVVDDVTGNRTKLIDTEKIDTNAVHYSGREKDFNFITTGLIEFKFKQTPLIFELRDFEKQESLGEIHFTLADLIKTKDYFMDIPVSNSNPLRILLRATKLPNLRYELNFKIDVENLTDPSSGRVFTVQPNPYILVSRINDDGTYLPVWQNNPLLQSDPIKWKDFIIRTNALCMNDYHRPFRIQLYLKTNKKNEKDLLVGSIDTTIDTLLTKRMNSQGQEDRRHVFPLRNSKASLIIEDAYVDKKRDFIEYLHGGCEISLITAIDCSQSNQHDPANSLHSLTGPHLNPYQQAIKYVGSILEHYDSDKIFPLYGFALRLKDPPSRELAATQHCYPLHETAVGVDGMLRAYSESMPQIRLSGPTYLASMVKKAAEIARSHNCCQEHQHYSILLVITDGAIEDLDRTKRAIIEASTAPLSIVIIGVGNNEQDFESMKELDSDEKLLEFEGQKASRDIVQFVRLKDSADYSDAAMAALAENVMEEIPTQFLLYMNQHSIIPNPNKV